MPKATISEWGLQTVTHLGFSSWNKLQAQHRLQGCLQHSQQQYKAGPRDTLAGTGTCAGRLTRSLMRQAAHPHVPAHVHLI